MRILSVLPIKSLGITAFISILYLLSPCAIANSNWTINNGTNNGEIHLKQTALKDPTKPVNNAAPRSQKTRTGGNLKLNSVVIQTTQSYAVINNRIYHRGQKVRGIRITKITEDHVLLANGRKLTLFKSLSQK